MNWKKAGCFWTFFWFSRVLFPLAVVVVCVWERENQNDSLLVKSFQSLGTGSWDVSVTPFPHSSPRCAPMIGQVLPTVSVFLVKPGNSCKHRLSCEHKMETNTQNTATPLLVSRQKETKLISWSNGSFFPFLLLTSLWSQCYDSQKHKVTISSSTFLFVRFAFKRAPVKNKIVAIPFSHATHAFQPRGGLFHVIGLQVFSKKKCTERLHGSHQRQRERESCPALCPSKSQWSQGNAVLEYGPPTRSHSIFGFWPVVQIRREIFILDGIHLTADELLLVFWFWLKRCQFVLVRKLSQL